MPTYVYSCSSCQSVFEVDQRITEDPLTDCTCGAKGSLMRLIQPAGIVFKGSGFHINDYVGFDPKPRKPKERDASPKCGDDSNCACSLD